MINFNKRQYIWSHNGLYGFTKQMKRNLSTIMGSDSTTPAAKLMASDILDMVDQLSDNLYKYRMDDGKVVEIHHKGDDELAQLQQHSSL